MLLGAYNIPPKVLFYKENSALISELLQPDGNQSLKPVWHDFSVIMQSYDPALSNYSDTLTFAALNRLFCYSSDTIC